jgi:DNA polymerase-1
VSDFTYQYIVHRGDLDDIATLVWNAKTIGLDLETEGFDPLLGKPRLLSMNIDDVIFIVDLFKTGGLTPKLRNALDNDTADWRRALMILQNAVFDQKWMLHHFGVILFPLFDTFRASKLIYNGSTIDREGHKLTKLYERELGKETWVPQMGGSNWSEPELSRKQLDYAAEDVHYLPKLYPVLRKKLADLGLLRVAKLEMEAVLPQAEIELNGFRLDPELWTAQAQIHKEEAHKRKMSLLQNLPHPTGQFSLFADEGSVFNLDSSAQLQQSLKRMGVELENTDKMTLAMSADKYPIIKDIIDYRKYSKRAASFGVEYLKHLHPVTQRIHCRYYGFTGAGRYSCSSPNVQQVPNAPIFRRCFRAPEGRVIIAVDYGQIELRLIAEVSNDATLIRVYNEGFDVHTYTASLLCGMTYEKLARLKKEGDHDANLQRKYAKPVNFGLCLLPGTVVRTDQGEVPIERMEVGMRVETHRGLWRSVTETQRVPAKGLIEIETEAGRRVQCTPDHRWLTDGRFWTPAGNLTMERKICTVEGLERITSLRRVDYEGDTFDITVDEDHSFIANGMVSHNCYGMKPAKLQTYATANYGVPMSLEQAQQFYDAYFEAYPSVRAWHNRVLRIDRKRGFGRTILGRIRYMDPEFEYNAFFNLNPQGSGADGLKRALWNVYWRLKKYGRRAFMVHMVHDEIIVECDDDPELIEAVKKDVELGMVEGMQGILTKVPCVAEGAHGPSWAEAH